MSITDRTRKILWARSGNRCAICKSHLVHSATITDRESIVGDECHIIARSGDGPRGGALSDAELDELDNLILLCKTDHKVVDDQPGKFTSSTLREIRSEHETWVETALTVAAEPPAREEDISAAIESRLQRLEFLQESLLPVRYVLLAIDLREPAAPSSLGHFRGQLRLARSLGSPPVALHIGGRDAYVTYHIGGNQEIVFGQKNLAWIESPMQVIQSTVMSFGQRVVPQIVFESAAPHVADFASMHELAQCHTSLYLTKPLWELASRISIVASDYVLASYERAALVDLTGDPTNDWPDHLTDAERRVPWRSILPKGPDYHRYEIEGESAEWFPQNLYRPWLTDVFTDTPTRIRRQPPAA